MRGLILAGGKGTRLLPATKVVNKHMVPILNNPMITYPLNTLKDFGITDIMVVSGGEHIGGIADFLNDGSEFGVNLTYRVQKDAGGIAQALGLAGDFVNDDNVMVILGDNVFGNIAEVFDNKVELGQAAIFVKYMKGASRFGVLDGDKIIEKPTNIDVGDVVTGLYIYPPDVFDVVKTLKPSNRGELEITSVNNFYLESSRCKIYRMYDTFWSDSGTPDSLFLTTKWAYERRSKNK